MSAFFCYLKARRADVKTKEPTLKVTEVVSVKFLQRSLENQRGMEEAERRQKENL